MNCFMSLYQTTATCKVLLTSNGYSLSNQNYHYALFTNLTSALFQTFLTARVPRQLVYGHFVYDTSSTDISSTTVYQRVAQLYIQLLFQQIIIFINSNFYLHYDS